MGLANKIAYKFATKMYSTFEQAAGLVKVEHVGSDQGNRPRDARTRRVGGYPNPL